MLKNPKVGQTVVTGRQECCESGFKEGTVVVINEILNPDSCIVVQTEGRHFYHCPRCLHRPKKEETL